MKLDAAFYRLPFLFDIEKLKEELGQFDESLWMPHPNQHRGNSAIPLISLNGKDNNFFHGEMLATAHLKRCSYTQQVLASIDEVFGRSRFMRLAPGCEVPLHSDTNYHWHTRVRIHIPITTDPEVIFHCGDEQVHMAAGECWIFDSLRPHKVVNNSDITRVHLVVDTAGSAKFWQMIQGCERPDKVIDNTLETKSIHYDAKKRSLIRTEKFNTTPVKSPGEVDGLIAELIADFAIGSPAEQALATQFEQAFTDFRHDWRALFFQYGYEENGFAEYNALINNTAKRVSAIDGEVLSKSNGQPVHLTLFYRIFDGAVAPEQKTLFSGGQLATKKTTLKKTKPIKAAEKASNTGEKTKRKTGRNEPCPCGSGKKYKLCHG